MSDYKPGDRMRATFDVVFLGSTGLPDGVIEVREPDGDTRWHLREAWMVKIEPPLPSTPGSVVAFRPYFWVLANDGFWYGKNANSGCADSMDASLLDAAEVIFDAGAV